MDIQTTKTGYAPLSPKLMVQLAAPHTWTASILPVALALCLAHVSGIGEVHALAVMSLLAISVLFQSAVNIINDYFDYIKGTDTADNQPDPEDAVLVYNNVNPRHVLIFAICLIALAFALGVYCIFLAGWVPLAIALVGVAVVFLYSGGQTPISYLPIGELVSGFVMGGLITVASVDVLTGRFSLLSLVYAIPVMLGIGLIMMTNNGCDIEKDVAAGRKTLPVVLGYERMVKAYHGVVFTWMASICLIVVVAFTPGWVVLPFLLLIAHAPGRALLGNPLTQATRAAAFSQCMTLNITLGSFYLIAILFAGSAVL